MILHPGILALTCGSGLSLLLLLYASVLGIKILRHWDFSSSSETQLTLERKTALVSTLINYVFGFELCSTFLFVFTADEIHPLLTGAMCATGALNANPIGWYALCAKILLFFAAALWLALNYVDGRVEDYPLVRRKYALLLLFSPLAATTFYLQTAYFLGLHPEVITSCCGSLFSAAGSGVAADLTGLEIKPTMAVFYGSGLLFLASAFLCLRGKGSLPRYLFSLLAAIFFPVSIAAVVSFISLYIYQLPTHHCPFDLLQKNYGFIGYWLYGSLFAGTLFGLLPGLFQPLKAIPSIALELQKIEVKWIYASVAATLCFLFLASWPVAFSHIKLVNYAPQGKSRTM